MLDSADSSELRVQEFTASSASLDVISVSGRDPLARWVLRQFERHTWPLILLLFAVGCTQAFGVPELGGHLLPLGPITLNGILAHPGSSGLTDIPDVIVWLVAVPLFGWCYVRQFGAVEHMFAALQRNQVTGRTVEDYNADFVIEANRHYRNYAPFVIAVILAILYATVSMTQLWPITSTLLDGAQVIGILVQTLGVFAGATYFFRYLTTFRLLRSLLDTDYVQPRLLDNHELGGFWPIVKFAEKAFMGFATIGFIVVSQSDILVPFFHQGSLKPDNLIWNLLLAIADLAALLILLYLPLWLIFSRLRSAKYRLLRRIGAARSGRVWYEYRSNNIDAILPLLSSLEDARQIIESLPSSLFSKHRARQESFLLVAAAFATQLGPSAARWLVTVISSHLK